VTRVLVVGETARSIGEFRRPWVRRAFAAYVARYRARLARAVRALPPGEITVLAGRDFVDGAALPAGVAVRRYDEEAFHADAAVLGALGTRIVESWWPRGVDPALELDGVWLPDLLPVGKAILLRLEVLEALGALERVLDDVRPVRLVLVTGASLPERLARALAAPRAIPVDVAGAFLPARVVAAGWRGLLVRQERAVLRRLQREPRAAPEPVHPRVVLSVCQARHLDLVAPLAASLEADGARCRLLAGLVDDGGLDRRLLTLRAEGLATARLVDFLPRREAAALVRGLAPARRRLRRRLRTDPAVAEAARHAGARLGPIVTPFGIDAVRWSLPAAALSLAAAARALAAEPPAAVIVSSDRRHAERALALAARRRGIPTLLFWGASLLARDRSNRFDIADRILVIGEHVRAELIAQGLEPWRIAVVGDPRSDAARRLPRARLRAEVARALGLPGDERPLLVLVSKYVSVLFSPTEKEAFYRTVHAALGALDGARVVVKAHPNEDVGLLRRQAAAWGWPADSAVTQAYDIHRLFAAADAAIMVTSMAGTEAMALGCPVVAVQTPGKDFEGAYMPPYVSEGAVARVDLDDAAALGRTLRQVLGDAAVREELIERGRKFSARYLNPVDGRLAERVLAVVDEIRAERAGGARP
jgi:glycosyltransferase involved in cell wall biosynthesis